MEQGHPKLPRLSALDPTFNLLLPPFFLPATMKQSSTMKGNQEIIRKSVKKNLSGVLSGAFRRRGDVDTDRETLVCPSESSSECSTLIDFVIYEPEEVVVPLQQEFDSLSEFLDEDNLAWNTKAPSSRSPQLQSLQYSSRTWAASRSSLLDENECSWVMPRATPRTTAGGRNKMNLFSKKAKPQPRASVPIQSSDLLEPEERSWM